MRELIENALVTWLQEESGIPVEEISPSRSFAELGVDSLRAIEVSRELKERLDIELTPVVAWQYPTSSTMSEHLAQTIYGLEVEQHSNNGATNRFDRLLAEIEAMSDEAAETMLRDK